MPCLCLLLALFSYLPAATPAPAAATDTMSAGHPLRGADKLVSGNGRFALGFYQPAGSESGLKNLNWYLGIWFNTVPKLTPVWVANGESPIKDPSSSELRISDDGNLVILSQTGSVVWSSRANVTTNVQTIAVLLSSGNLVLRDASNSSHVLWESFDHPTDTLLPGAKLGRNKVTGLNRRLVSRKNSIDPAPGVYSLELDPNDARQFIYVWNSSTTYWASGDWEGKYFSTVPEMAHTESSFVSEFVSKDQEDYLTYRLGDDTMLTRTTVVSGQAKQFVCLEASQSWMPIYAQPPGLCDVYAVCGPFTVCDDTMFPTCSCMKGFSVRSPRDWELDDRTGGCVRNTPLCCGGDKFYAMRVVRLPANARGIEAGGPRECAQACLSNCSCTGYSYGSTGCFVWYSELLNVKQQYDGTTNKGTLYLRLAASEVQNSNNGRRGPIIGLVTGASLLASGLLALVIVLIWKRNRRELAGKIEGGLLVFRYSDLQHATKNFSEKIGGGSFGSVFKGLLCGSAAIAVKRLDGVRQGEKQFRAEVSSIGIIQHVNLVKLIGFCSEGTKRLLVYQYMVNHSLDKHLFRSNDAVMFLSWNTRYQIALEIARGLAYLHENCRDCIIHCDIKPQNILLDASFVPKIADFGMAKFVGKEFSRVLTTVRGTIGYLAPEWITGAAITKKVDVYSYGMVLLEIVSGRRTRNLSEENSSDATFFPVQAASKLVEGDVECLVDHKLHGDVNLKEVERVCKVAYWCIQDNEFNRPTMGEIVRILEGLVEIKMPPVPRLLQAIAEN